LVDLQLIGVLVTATSVTIAAIYYIVNLKETLRNRRVALATSLMQTFISEEGSRRWIDIIARATPKYPLSEDNVLHVGEGGVLQGRE
jgi:hypothetical protein